MVAKISFASFNLFNFQKAGGKVYDTIVTRPEYIKKLEWTQQRIIDLDADVIIFQELWAKSCLDDVFKHPKLANYTPIYIGNKWYQIAVAAAVRTPWRVKQKKVIKNFPFSSLIKIDLNDGEDDDLKVNIKRFSRSVLRLKLEHTSSAKTPGIILYGAHLKAKIPSDTPQVQSKHRAAIGGAISTIRRTAEAAALRWMLTNHMKGSSASPTVVIGDLNDDPRSNTLAILTEQPTMTPAARGGDTALYSSLLMQQFSLSFRDVYYTYEYKNRKDAIDHILVSEEFFASSNRKIWKLKETRIWNDFIEDNHSHTSDHGIIRASFI